MNDFLTNDEVTALLMGVTGETDEYFEEEAQNIREYKIGKEERVVRGRMPNLELIHEYFARLFRVNLYHRLHRNVEVSVGPIRIQRYSEFIRNLVVPTNLNLVNFNSSLSGEGLVVFDPNLIFLAVDNVFGGDGRFHTRVEGRDFTFVENEVIDELFLAFKESYLKSFNQYYPLEMSFVRREMNSQFAYIAAPNEIVMSTTFTLEFGGATADMHICMTYNSLEKIVHILKNMTYLTNNESFNEKINLKNVKFNMKVNGNTSKKELHEIKSLKVGEVLFFENVTASVSNKDLFVGEVINNNFLIKEKL